MQLFDYNHPMLKRHWAAALLFLALTLLLTNPLALHLWNAVEDKQDALLNTWIIAWVGHAALTDPLNLYNANIFYPYPNTLAFSEVLIPQGLLALPIILATNNPILSYNLVLLAMFWLNAFGMYLLVLDWTHKREAGWIAGAIYSFNPFNLGNLAQIQLVSLGWLPLVLFFLQRVLNPRERNRAFVSRDAILFALCFVLQALASIYYALLGGFAVAIFLMWWLWRERARITTAVRASIVPLAFSFFLIAALLIPFLLPYFSVQRDLGFQRRVEESEPFSASLKQYGEVSPENLLYGKWLAPNPVKRVGGYPLDNLFPGIVALVLAAIGLARARDSRERWFLFAFLLLAFVLSLGPRLFLTSEQPTDVVLPYRWLYEIFSPLRALRAPVRFDALVMLAVAALAGLGYERVLARAPRKLLAGRVELVSLGWLALIAFEYLTIPAAHTVALPVASEIPTFYKALAHQTPTVILELPMMGPDTSGQLDISNQYFSTYHWQKTPDGYSGFVPPRRGEIAYEMESFPSERAIAAMQALDVEYLILHFDRFKQSRNEIEGALARMPGVAPVQEFGTATVYRIPHPADQPNDFVSWVYLPQPAQAGAPYTAFYVLFRRGGSPLLAKPSDRIQFTARWSDGRIENLSAPLPLVTTRMSVIPLMLTAPSSEGATLEIKARFQDLRVGAQRGEVQLSNEGAREILIPARLFRVQNIAPEYSRGSEVNVDVEWEVLGKIDAYYSASVRVVKENGDKIVAVDRQPRTPTLLWKPDTREWDSFALKLPDDLAPGKYRVELLMYDANRDIEAVMFDPDWNAHAPQVLGEFIVK